MLEKRTPLEVIGDDRARDPNAVDAFPGGGEPIRDADRAPAGTDAPGAPSFDDAPSDAS